VLLGGSKWVKVGQSGSKWVKVGQSGSKRVKVLKWQKSSTKTLKPPGHFFIADISAFIRLDTISINLSSWY